MKKKNIIITEDAVKFDTKCEREIVFDFIVIDYEKHEKIGIRVIDQEKPVRKNVIMNFAEDIQCTRLSKGIIFVSACSRRAIKICPENIRIIERDELISMLQSTSDGV